MAAKIEVTPLLLVGGGRMGAALLNGWLETGVAADGIHIVEPMPAPALVDLRHDGVQIAKEPGEFGADFAPTVVVFAVKPQIIGTLLDQYRGFAEGKTVFLSIAAGITIARLSDALGRKASIVRAMPNTPAAVGSGMTVLTANRRVGKAGRTLCQSLMAAVGETAWIEDETLMDAVTGVSGSGPAYVFALVEAMAQAGIDAGLPAELSAQLARATVIGGGDLLRQARETAAELRENVTSPGGTTAAALEILLGPDGLTDLMSRAVARATARGAELAAES